ncbi:MAG: aminodeoxychorismate synthase component I [Trebonia sp.]|jgi:para-aminobenzoate synthetase/4-amino-4-deoxychorismate lyase
MPGRTEFAVVRRPLGWRLTPTEVLRLVRADAHPVALFGTWAGGRDVVAAEPALVRSAPGAFDEVLDSPLPPAAGGAFGGGWIGYLGYSAGGEALRPAGPGRLPAWWFGWYDHVLVHEPATGEWFFEALWTRDRTDALERRFADLAARAARPAPSAGYEFAPFRLNPGPAGHQEAVARAVEYIRGGDIFQANICLRAEAGFAGDPLDAFCRAAADLRPPYAAFIDVSATPAANVTGGAPAVARAAVASLSPELFLHRGGDAVTSKPIKGTARRGGDAAAAAGQLAELERSAKNRAENVMIVDLVRNDLSRVCVPGTVTVPGLLSAEPHPGVWHLVSTVAGTLAGGVSDGDLIRAAFPPGSVTGAPKVRALEIIDELERAPREAYTGAVGYRSPVAGLELNVAIRTFEFAAGRCWLGAGGGIVADSDPEAEYAECLIKAAPLLAAIGARLDAGPPDESALDALAALRPRPSAGVFSSLRVTDGQTQGLADHLARLSSSVRDLYGKDLPASLDSELAGCLAARPTGRLRISVRPVGGPLQASVEVVPLPPASAAAAIRLLPVVVAGGIGRPKWRDRRLLAELNARAGPAADAQLLITDETGEVLETDRANVFAVIDGVLLTPPADGRLLPGTARAAVMRAARADAVKVGQKPLTLDQLTAATEVFVTNAVVGVLPVTAIDGCPVTWTPGPVAAALAAALTARRPDPAAGLPLPVGSDHGERLPISSLSTYRGKTPGKVVLTDGRCSTAAPTDRKSPLVVLIDNYDSFTWNLAHLLSIGGARVEVVRNDEVTAAQVAEAGAGGVVISPGPCAPAEAGISIDAVRSCAAAGLPLLGICLGHQAIAAAFGAAIVRAPRPVHGQAFDVTHDGLGVLAGLPDPFRATRYHSLIVDEATLPSDLAVTARTGPLPMGIRHLAAPIEGVQFHPESILTPQGEQIIRNFVTATWIASTR